VNDNGALGRDTKWEAPTRDIDADSDSEDDDDSGLNPKESRPMAIDGGLFPKDVVFVQVEANDSTSFVLTDDGFVYGWGTFSVSLNITYLIHWLTFEGKRWCHRLFKGGSSE